MFISRRAATFFGFAAILPSVKDQAQAAQSGALPFPTFDPAYDVPGAQLKQTPEAKGTYKVVFDLVTGSATADKIHPLLEMAARYANTLAKYGVPAERRKIALVFHQQATRFTLKDEAYPKHNDGHANPNSALIKELKKGGIDLRVCGQGLLNNKFDAAEIVPEVQVDLWALTTLIDLGQQGYVRI